MILKKTLKSPIRLFADDSAIYREIRSIEDTEILQQDLFKLQNWADTWQMKFNVKKCKILRITRKTKLKINHTYVMSTPSSPTPDLEVTPDLQNSAKEVLLIHPPDGNYTPLEEITSDKYLGVILDNKLSFNQHVDAITKKATNLLNLCRRNLHMCPPAIKEAA